MITPADPVFNDLTFDFQAFVAYQFLTRLNQRKFSFRDEDYPDLFVLLNFAIFHYDQSVAQITLGKDGIDTHFHNAELKLSYHWNIPFQNIPLKSSNF